MLARHLGIPPRRGTTSFLSAVFIDALGTGFFAPFSLLYFNVVVGLPLTAVGLAVSIATIFTIPLIPLTGILVDRFGARRLVIAAQILQGAGFLGYLVVHNIPLLVLMAFFTAAGQRIFWSSYFTLATDMAAFGERDRWFGLLGTALITGVGIGNFLAGVLISAAGQSGYFVIIIINTLSFFLAATLLYVGVPASQHSKASETAHGGYRVVLRDRPFIAMIIVNIAFALCISLIGLGLPVYAANGLHLPVWVAGVALALNTALIAILQTILVRLLEPMRRTRAL
ncbi:MAG: MFS transporter, partial [Ktedonobacteraceae bacterium]|nr:MFS transporter [Ktedonobacteraceae bacterium]